MVDMTGGVTEVFHLPLVSINLPELLRNLLAKGALINCANGKVSRWRVFICGYWFDTLICRLESPTSSWRPICAQASTSWLRSWDAVLHILCEKCTSPSCRDTPTSLCCYRLTSHLGFYVVKVADLSKIVTFFSLNSFVNRDPMFNVCFGAMASYSLSGLSAHTGTEIVFL